MQKDQIKIVKRTWRKLMLVDPVLIADLFYTKLFNENPGLRKLFPKDMTAQYEKLTNMLTSIITSLEHLDEMKTEIQEMAVRHESYHVKPEHYHLVGAALLWTLEKGLGYDWNGEVKEAWESCYTALAQMMLKEHQKEKIIN
jgi:hemoglobin-like flavoprotein